jgi:hypothetical protein
VATVVKAEILDVGWTIDDGANSEREETGVEAGELGLDGGVVEEIGVDEFAESGVLLVGWGAHDGEDLLHVGVEEALAKNALADHSSRSEENYIHAILGIW